MALIFEVEKEILRVDQVAHVKIVDVGCGTALEIRLNGNPEPIHIMTENADLEYHMLAKKIRENTVRR